MRDIRSLAYTSCACPRSSIRIRSGPVLDPFQSNIQSLFHPLVALSWQIVHAVLPELALIIGLLRYRVFCDFVLTVLSRSMVLHDHWLLAGFCGLRHKNSGFSYGECRKSLTNWRGKMEKAGWLLL